MNDVVFVGGIVLLVILFSGDPDLMDGIIGFLLKESNPCACEICPGIPATDTLGGFG